MACAGLPTQILWAYTRIMTSMTIINCLPMGAGTPYKRKCSIPQGCPWSMTVLALMAYPWIAIVKQHTSTIPRVLADDLSLWAAQSADPDIEDPNKWKTNGPPLFR